MPLEGGSDAVRRRLPDVEGLEDFYDQQGFGPVLRNQAQRLAQLPLS